MEINRKKWFLRQKDGLKQMEKLGVISQLSISNLNEMSRFEFNLINQTDFSNEDISWVDFQKYRVQINLSIGNEPVVYMLTGLDAEKPPHTYISWNLCMYHSSEKIWSDKGTLATDILPLIYTWTYFYEVWKITGVWYAKEYKH